MPQKVKLHMESKIYQKKASFFEDIRPFGIGPYGNLVICKFGIASKGRNSKGQSLRRSNVHKAECLQRPNVSKSRMTQKAEFLLVLFSFDSSTNAVWNAIPPFLVIFALSESAFRIIRPNDIRPYENSAF